jgi:hypothetical protein
VEQGAWEDHEMCLKFPYTLSPEKILSELPQSGWTIELELTKNYFQLNPPSSQDKQVKTIELELTKNYF